MKKTLHKARIHLFIAGISSLLFAVITLAFPAISLLSLIGLFAGYMIIKGLAISLGAWRTHQEEIHWMYLLAYGILNIITGVIAFVYPEATMIILGFIVSVNLFAGGILQIAIAIHLRKEIKGDIWLVLSGMIAVIAGIYIYIIPRIGALAILYFIAIAALMLGIFLVSLSLHIGTWHKKHNKLVKTA